MKKTSFIIDYQKVMAHLENINFALPDLDIQKSELFIEIPNRFSISEQPNETIKLLRKLYAIVKYECVENIYLDYSKCEFLGLSASTIMDIILFIVIEHRKKEHKLIVSGKIPENQMVRDVLLESGLLYHLNAKYRPERDGANVEKFETVSGGFGENKGKSGKIATELTDYFNKCLLHQKMRLKDEGILLFATLLGEVLDNCEIHGGEQATWYTQGHYEDNPSETYGEMQLLF